MWEFIAIGILSYVVVKLHLRISDLEERLNNSDS